MLHLRFVGLIISRETNQRGHFLISSKIMWIEKFFTSPRQGFVDLGMLMQDTPRENLWNLQLNWLFAYTKDVALNTLAGVAG